MWVAVWFSGKFCTL